MAFKFVDKLPEQTRISGTGTPLFSDAQVESIKDNAGKWATVAEDVTTAQNYTNWAKRMNGKDETGNTAEGPYYVATRAHRDSKGVAHTEQRTVATGANKGKKTVVRYVDVYVCYSPDGRPEGVRKQ